MKKWQKKILRAIKLPHLGVGGQHRIEVNPELFPVACCGCLTSDWRSAIVVTGDLKSAESLADGIRTFLSLIGNDTEVRLLPEPEDIHGHLALENESERSRILYDTQTNTCIYVASVAGLLAPAPDPESFRKKQLSVTVGEAAWPPQKLAAYLVELNYDNEPLVSQPGEFSWRGGILDLFSPALGRPMRIEYWGDRIDSIRFFDPSSQRSDDTANNCLIIPVISTVSSTDSGNWSSFSDFVATEERLTIAVDPNSIEEHLDNFESNEYRDKWASFQRRQVRTVTIQPPGSKKAGGKTHRLSWQPLSHELAPVAEDLESIYDELQKQYLAANIQRWSGDGYEFVVCARDKGTIEQFSEAADDLGNASALSVAHCTSDLRSGMIFQDERILLLAESDIYGYSRLPQKRMHRAKFQTDLMITTGLELHDGDFAVHAVYGICRFLGLTENIHHDSTQEVLMLEFDDDMKLYVPLEQLFLVSRYVGGGKRLPKLSKIGGSRWQKAKFAATTAIKDLAADLLRLQAVRDSSEGFPFLVNDESSERYFSTLFPYDETVDQEQAIWDVLDDMSKPRPMDRLICGDVGYGKTEVAMRAAFRSVSCGKQVVILSPTTLLAQQHSLTFAERFKHFPILIAMLSRFSSPKQQRRIIIDLAEGKIDIVIGTHRLLQPDLVFRDLGLIIIDEEQRFGVKHKERLKKLRANVDILTMTATPIPRTLYLSMSGLRDMSTIMTAPEERLPIQTVVAEHSNKVIREAVVRELGRGGQVFFLHNRIRSINSVRDNLQRLIPDAIIDVAHGRMDESDLENVMLRFISGETDVLVSTTIIESGLDIPNANTIIVDRADRFGLAELYQIRGRVGRYHRQAYAHFLIPRETILVDAAKQRLAAIQKYNQLGAGFKLAMRDLEIRGAGNILGFEQSGHISAIGFNLYCQLLKQAVARLKEQPAPVRPDVALNLDFVVFGESTTGRLSASIAKEYVSDDALRVQLYRRMGELMSIPAVDEFAAELRDRFGPLPDAAQNVLKIVKLKIVAGNLGIHAINVHAKRMLCETDSGIMKNSQGSFPRLKSRNPEEFVDEMIVILTHLQTVAVTPVAHP